MIPPIVPVTAIASASPSAAALPTTAATGSDSFSNVLSGAIDALDATTSNADALALQGATGQANIADVTVAANEAQLAVQLAATVRDDGVAAVNSIMSMQAG